MVPGNLPSQLEILSTGQNYYETGETPCLKPHALLTNALGLAAEMSCIIIMQAV